MKQKLLLMPALLIGAMTGTMATEYVTNVKLIGCSESRIDGTKLVK
jgi:hypothetical protein